MMEKYPEGQGGELVTLLLNKNASEEDLQGEFSITDESLISEIFSDFWKKDRYVLPINDALPTPPKVMEVKRVFRPAPTPSKFKRQNQFTVTTQDPVDLFWTLQCLAKDRTGNEPAVSKSKWAFKYTANQNESSVLVEVELHQLIKDSKYLVAMNRRAGETFIFNQVWTDLCQDFKKKAQGA